MSGYPDLPTLNDYGPPRKNVRPIRSPTTELGADEMNLTFWQLAGAGRTLPIAVFIFDPNATPGSEVSFQALAFDPRQELPTITPVVNGVGSFTWTFATTYNNQQGTPRPFTPRAGIAMAQGAAPEVKAGISISGQDVTVGLQDASDVAIDVAFILQVW